jgi:hypothetical protein
MPDFLLREPPLELEVVAKGLVIELEVERELDVII